MRSWRCILPPGFCVEKLLHRHWVKSGELDAEVARRFSKLRMLIDADYSADFVFTVEGAAEEVAVAREFVGAARALLIRQGWLSSPPGS